MDNKIQLNKIMKSKTKFTIPMTISRQFIKTFKFKKNKQMILLQSIPKVIMPYPFHRYLIIKIQIVFHKKI